MELNIGDKIKIIQPNSSYFGRTGTIKHVICEDGENVSAMVATLDLGAGEFPDKGFFPHEVEKFDATKEALIVLAETLDDAGKQAKAIEDAASQDSVYGLIRVALVDTLSLIVDDYSMAKDVYYSMVSNGNSVRKALVDVK